MCISDQGREFVNEVNQRLFDRVGVEHRISSAYHPQTNGLDERMNQTVTKALIKYVDTEEDDWDEYLDAILFSYRTSIHASTKYKMKGFQNTALGCNLSFDIMRTEFVQILFNGNNHWVTISTVGLPQPACCINVYDSLYETLTDFTKDQICALLCSGEHCITARLMKVHKQKNMSDCGLLAIAYATSICNGDDVCTIQYASSMKMRGHLVKCFQESKMSPFPSTV